MKPWNIGNNKVLNIKMPICLHWCQSAPLSLISDFFFFYNFLSSVCSIVVFIKFCFCSTQYYRFCYYYVPFFNFKPFWCPLSFDECVVHSVMHVQIFFFFFLVGSVNSLGTPKDTVELRDKLWVFFPSSFP